VVRTQIQNMVTGVSAGFTRELDIVGVGYRAATKGNVSFSYCWVFSPS
jgi:large subunit ribosomal protein L6